MTSRRTFLASLASPLLAQAPEPVIDIHQHTNYSGRSDAELVAHQHDMGIQVTVLLPAGSKYGLAAGAGGNDTVVATRGSILLNTVSSPTNCRIFRGAPVIERYLKMAPCGSEQKFPVDADSPHIDLVADARARRTS
jgi:hypothetical protein